MGGTRSPTHTPNQRLSPASPPSLLCTQAGAAGRRWPTHVELLFSLRAGSGLEAGLPEVGEGCRAHSGIVLPRLALAPLTMGPWALIPDL